MKHARYSFRFLLEFVVAGIAAAGAIAMQWSRLDRVSSREIDPVRAERQAEIQLELLERSPTLGFDNLVADWVFLRYLQYFGDEEARQQTGCDLSDRYFEIVTQRDPRFLNSYMFISSGVSYCQGKPEKTIELLDRGIEAISPATHDRAFILPLFQALDRFLLLNDIEGAIASYELAANWAKEARFTSAAERYARTAQYLRDDPNSVEALFIGWQEVYRNAIDDSVRQRAITELESLGARVERQPNGEIRFVLPESATN
ncbi:hypothetical protein AY599_01390 [Leptolyngbya valderiana BDU 20041]|nr:hypothetical protein [Geitlerinema sp. CS-897]OAB61796.1 hypothetical protein AY599_01390 [Leptolyngbya valderiana BDU 20041]